MPAAQTGKNGENQMKRERTPIMSRARKAGEEKQCSGEYYLILPEG